LPREPIKVKLPDGKEKEGVSFQTTPLEIAKSISNSLPDKVVVAKVRYTRRVATLDDGLINPNEEKGEEGEAWELVDSTRPLEGDCDLKLITFDEPEGKMVFWHSSAHILGESMEREFGVHLCHGPPTDSGFFYDAYTGHDVILKQIMDYRSLTRITTRL
jgi:threonyl-tRNA synthetase